MNYNNNLITSASLPSFTLSFGLCSSAGYVMTRPESPLTRWGAIVLPFCNLLSISCRIGGRRILAGVAGVHGGLAQFAGCPCLDATAHAPRPHPRHGHARHSDRRPGSHGSSRSCRHPVWERRIRRDRRQDARSPALAGHPMPPRQGVCTAGAHARILLAPGA